MGTLGRLLIDDDHELFTIERPWLNNEAFKSCIPQGAYQCHRYSSAKYPDTFEVGGVPGRSKILFHVANYPRNVQGCIGLGMDLMGDRCAVSRSRDAVAEFDRLMSDVNQFELLVTQFRPEYP
jgi:hypothetical protein